MESDRVVQPPATIPALPRRQTTENVAISRQRFSKSRNGMFVSSCLLQIKPVGCVTCKARRVKCDETKPTCEQCARRRITCGGYKIDVRWKQAAEPKKYSPPNRNRGGSSSDFGRPFTGQDDSPIERQGVSRMEFDYCTGQNRQNQLGHTSEPETMNIAFTEQDAQTSPLDLPSPRSLNFIISGMDQGLLTALPPTEQVANSTRASPQTVESSGNTSFVDHASELWNMDNFWEDYLKTLPTTPIDFEAQVSQSRAMPGTLGDVEDEAGSISLLFHKKICHTLSIDEEMDKNPWSTLIWPLTEDNPTLYHALAALTCFCKSKQQPHFHIEGARHVRQSSQMLSDSMRNGDIPTDAALATALVLAFVETCSPDSSVGLNHIQTGGILLQQLIANHGDLLLDRQHNARLKFLARTWTYLDVLARFTCSDLCQETSSPKSFEWEQLGGEPSRLDPLMGYATTFFPTMRCVADLINKVKRREPSRNSPAIISQALDLRRRIEEWTPPIDFETIDDPSQNMTDAIQTAEAYRWSTLLLLYQAVPELPNLTSYGELAQKILVYLATIPTSSKTIVVHAFPLIVAGCDAVEEEDRDFVRERWHAMSQRMVTSVVERCLKVTEELWRRREEYLLQRGLAFRANGTCITPASHEQTALSNDIASFINAETSPTTGATSPSEQSNNRSIRKGNDFPISAAFKKGVDILTRSGSTEYTVRGRLHWLGVIKDWNWHLILA